MGDSSLFNTLRESFSQKHEEIKANVLEKHKDSLALITNYPAQLSAGVMGAALLMVNTLPVLPQHSLVVKDNIAVESSHINPSGFLISDLQKVLPEEMRELTPEEEAQVSNILSRDFKMPVSAELEGIRLNRSYGLMGAEQHLARYPGDTMATHFNPPAGGSEDSQKYYSSGMAPGLGAWGYFAPSQYDLTQTDIDREKYYIAVQTFLAPGFDENVYKYITFFKHRKMLAVNPQNGKAMVVVIGDAGPGRSTGKHLGGSPEVMKYLERVDGKQKGPVLYFFIDDPNDTVPLGPIEAK